MADSIKKLQELFSRFPTIGARTAGRFVYYLLKLPQENVDELLRAIAAVKQQVKLCAFCFNPFEGGGTLCPICQNPGRNRQLLCIVEKETDVQSIESTKRYNGRYFILGSASTFTKRDIETLRLSELKQRIEAERFSEIIVALNPTPEGRAASTMVHRVLKEIPAAAFKITHLATGLPVGGELEYADDETLQNALEGRK